MRRKLTALTLVLFLLLPLAAQAKSDRTTKNVKKTPLYYGIITRRYANSTTSVYAEMDKDTKAVRYMNPGTKIDILEVYPNWVEIDNNGKSGYVLRNRIDVLEAVDPVHTPPYPCVVHRFYAVIDRTVYVKSDKSAESETLSTLTAGARAAFIGVEDGWAKLIYHRQYGYIDTRELGELLPVAGDVSVADAQTPVAVFTSYYNDNKDRINNLTTACGYISKVMQPGETMNFNDTVGPFNARNGYLPAPVLVDGKVKNNYGGGSCQVSSTLWDTLIQLPGIITLMRKPHGDNAASYLPHGNDASSGTDNLNLIFRNDYDFPIRIDASTHDNALFVAIYKETK